MARTPVILASSGGKDSVLALAALRAVSDWDVRGILVTVTDEDDAVVMHEVPRALVAQQASSLGLNLHAVSVPRNPANDVYEARMASALARLRSEGVRHIAFGDIFLAEVRDYRERMLARGDFIGVYPLWGRDSRELAHTFRRDGYQAIAVCVDGHRVPREFAGRDLDESFFAELPADVDPCGENGEFHSFVYDGPPFRYPVRFSKKIPPPAERFHHCTLIPATFDRCARCGAPFECGMQAGLAECWCAQLPPIAPPDAAASCYCPRCLAEVSGGVIDQRT
ncbi:MAG: cysteine-rich CWC family protein [Burkholderiales bacterium]